MLKYSNKRIIEVQDWDRLVQQTYGKPYNFQQQDGCKERGVVHITVSKEEIDDSYLPNSVPEVINGNEMGVNFKAWLARDIGEWNGKKGDEKYLDMFWERNFYPEVEVIANDLCRKGLIEEGEYTINIDW